MEGLALKGVNPSLIAKATGGIYGDYDYGAGGIQGANGHYGDIGKLPWHPTFSNESKYSNAETPGGAWGNIPGAKEQWVFTPSANMMNQEGYDQKLAQYLKNEYGRGIDKVEMPAPYAKPQVIQDTEEGLAMKAALQAANGKIPDWKSVGGVRG